MSTPIKTLIRDRGRTPTVPDQTLAAAYRVIAELLLNPDSRDAERVDHESAALAAAPAAIRDPIASFLAAPAAADSVEYTQTLELTPPCPLYLGAYIFDEPKSCRGAGMSGRNGYMIEIAAVYNHFGVALGGGELADYLPAMVEFLALSLEAKDRDTIGLRRRFVEQQVLPGLPLLRAALEKYESPYLQLIDALQCVVENDALTMFAGPIWVPPPEDGRRPPRPVDAPFEPVNAAIEEARP